MSKRYIIAVFFLLITLIGGSSFARSPEISQHIVSIQALTALPSYHIMVSGKPLNAAGLAAPAYSADGVIMVPLRRTAEQLGYTVTWDDTEQAARVDMSIAFMYFYPGSDWYYRIGTLKTIGLNASYQYGVGPFITDGRIYVPAKVFEAFFNDVAVSDSNASIAPQMAHID